MTWDFWFLGSWWIVTWEVTYWVSSGILLSHQVDSQPTPCPAKVTAPFRFPCLSPLHSALHYCARCCFCCSTLLVCSYSHLKCYDISNNVSLKISFIMTPVEISGVQIGWLGDERAREACPGLQGREAGEGPVGGLGRSMQGQRPVKAAGAGDEWRHMCGCRKFGWIPS